MPEISLRDVSFSYPGGPRVLDRVSLEVEHGSFLAVVGPSGRGKSTLLRLISGLSLPEEGTVSIGGEPVTGPAPGRSIVFQQGGLFPWLTARGNVAFALRKARPGLTRAQAAEQAEAALIRVGLKDALSRYPGELSGGMAQRVAIARALAVGGKVLLLDEPFGALDPKNRQALQQLLLELWQAEGSTVVMVTHDIDEAILLADRIAFFRPGGAGPTLSVRGARPRDPAAFLTSAECCVVRKRLIGLFYQYGEAVGETL